MKNVAPLVAIALILGSWLATVALWLTAIAAWITHVVVCIKTASWILLVFGCIVFPIGIIHGAGTWFGIF